jgi:hypothetical protein
MKHEKTFAAIEKLKDVELELHRLKNALEMANRSLDAQPAQEPTSGDYAMGYAEGFNDACEKPAQEPDRQALQANGTHPAPCARHCEAQAFKVEIRNLEKRLEQPAQEPVALVIDGVLVKSALPAKYTGHLYTTPPKRPWVGLTDEEVQDSYNADYQAQTRAVEAKLKEKNA